MNEYRPNPFGLHSVHGNVWEWCRDVYYSSYDTPIEKRERQLPGSHVRVFRGSSFRLEAEAARSASRGRNSQDSNEYDYGVRPARALDP